jgi:hypothetical protein
MSRGGIRLNEYVGWILGVTERADAGVLLDGDFVGIGDPVEHDHELVGVAVLVRVQFYGPSERCVAVVLRRWAPHP